MLFPVKDQGPRKPLGSGAESPAPGKVTTTVGLGVKAAAPRPPLKSNPEHTEPGGYQIPTKPLAPRAPSASFTSPAEKPGGLTEADVRILALAIAKEATKPLEDQIKSLEARLASAERTLDRTERTLGADGSGGHPAVVPAPTPAPAAVAFVPPPVVPAPAPAPAALVVPKAPASEPKAIEPTPRPAPKLSLDDVHLSSDELGMFDGSKRKNRIAAVFVLVVLLMAGGLVAAMIVSRS